MEQRLNYLIAGVFVALIFLTIIIVTAVLPATTFQPEASLAATNYDAPGMEAVKRGRDVYRREGCFYCHSQFSRYQDREVGEMVQAGDYVYETPHVLGTERTGPDLSNIGGKYSDGWHIAHHLAPRRVKPGSIMPSFKHLTSHEMNDLVAYLQSLGAKREQVARTRKEDPISWLEAPQEYRDKFHHLTVVEKVANVDSAAAANSGYGIYVQNCASCHGVAGRGNGPVSASMVKKPANFTRPFYKAYNGAMWYWRVAEGVPGTRMPKWRRSLSDEDMLYLVAYLKTLPIDSEVASKKLEVSEFGQIEDPKKLDQNYRFIEEMNHSPFGEERPYYGGGRGE
jgi:cbb3-type cytochrome oxidase cytochrome c subunit/cytochrome c553